MSTPTSKEPITTAFGRGDELVVRVVLGCDAETKTDDGSVVRLDGHHLTVVGPERDVLVYAGTRAVTRGRGDDLDFDLQAARDLHDAASPFDQAAVAAARVADATTGLRHRYFVTPEPPEAGESVTVWLESDRALTGASVAYTVDGTEPRFGQSPTAEMRPSPAAEGSDGWTWAALVPGQDAGTRVRYRIAARFADTPGDGTVDVTDAAPEYVYPAVHVPHVRPPRSLFSYTVAPPGPPRWARDAVVYHALVDRFASDGGADVDGDGVSLLGFAGGTLRGLTARLDHVADLGATVLWISPICHADTHVCYDTRNLFAVEPRFGTLADARALCDEAHGRGLRVILDLEMSYLGARHPAASAATAPDAPFGDWFHWTADPVRRFGWYHGNPTFAAVDHANERARAHLLDAARFWLDAGFDGFRLDSAHAASLDFWCEFGRTVRRHKADAFTVAEDTGAFADGLRYGGRLDGFLDFDLSRCLREVVGRGEGSVERLEQEAARRDRMPAALVAPCFLENHDGDRFEFVAGGDERRLRLALLLLCALPGPPVLYYGTEVGLAQDGPGDCDLVARSPMPWRGHDAGRLEFVRRTVGFRRRHPALVRGDRRPLVADARAGVWAFARVLDGDRVLVVANVSESEQSVTVPTGGLWPAGDALVDAVSGRSLHADRAGVSLTLEPLTGAVVTAPDHRRN